MKRANKIQVALLTGGGDRPYVFGLATSLMSKGAVLDLIGSDQLDCPEFRDNPNLRFMNLRGDQRSDASLLKKIFRLSMYYAKLICYSVTAKPKVFHILWNNKFQIFDRTLLMLYYRFLGSKVVLTVHNVNAGRRDLQDTHLNRITLRIQYRLADHIFVHTEKMKLELIDDFGLDAARVTVIPFGINNSVPNTRLTRNEAKQRLGIGPNERTVLFFGVITPYKGLEYLVTAFQEIVAQHENYRLIIAGKPDKCERYWRTIREQIDKTAQRGRVLVKDEFIPDGDTEVYFKAADILVLPYRHVYQSGVLFLGHSFGLPVLAADVGPLKDEVVEGKTGFVFRPEDAADLARAMERYFASELYQELEHRRQEIRDYTAQRHSWDVVSQTTVNVYADLLRIPSPAESLNREVSTASLDVNARS